MNIYMRFIHKSRAKANNAQRKGASRKKVVSLRRDERRGTGRFLEAMMCPAQERRSVQGKTRGRRQRRDKKDRRKQNQPGQGDSEQAYRGMGAEKEGGRQLQEDA